VSEELIYSLNGH